MEERLQKFARLVEIGSFTRAARELHISQPALTIAINKLEQELGSALLIRANRRFEITEAGRAAYRAAREQKNAADDLRAELRRITKKRPSVTLGMTDSIAAILCASVAFDTLEAAADVTVIVNNSRFVTDGVLGRSIDIGFVVDGGVTSDGLLSSGAGREVLYFVCAPELADSVTKNLCHGLLDNFISYDKPSTTHRIVQQALTRRDLQAHTTLYSTSPDVMLQMVLRGRGVAALPQHLVARLLEAGQVVSLVHADQPLTATRQLRRIQLPERQVPDCLALFIQAAGAILTD